MDNKDKELLNLLLEDSPLALDEPLKLEREYNEKSGRPYTTTPLHSQVYPVDIGELRKQALERGEADGYGT